MCLTIIDYINVPPKSGIGWKVFRKHYKGIAGIYGEFNFPRARPMVSKYSINRWFVAVKRMVMSADNEFLYLSGFHIYKARKVARENAGHNSTVLKVKYDGARIQGTQYGADVIVADRMLIVSTKKQTRK